MTINEGPDFNGNGYVDGDGDDLTLTMWAVGVTEPSRFDLDENGIVDDADVAIVAAQRKIDSEKQEETKQE